VAEARDNYLENLAPRRLGNLYCFWYGQGQPRIVIGPDYIFSLLELFILNGLSGWFLFTLDMKEHPALYTVGVVVLLL